MLHALASGSVETLPEVWWNHGARSVREHVFAREAGELLEAIPGSHLAIAYSKLEPTDRFGTDFEIQGHLNLESLQKLGIPVVADFNLCGPTGFLRDMTRCLASVGATESKNVRNQTPLCAP